MIDWPLASVVLFWMGIGMVLLNTATSYLCMV